MPDFNPTNYGPVLSAAISGDRCRPLDAGEPVAMTAELSSELTSEPGSAFAHTQVADHDMACCVLSGVWLLHDELDRSHTLSQSIHTPEGSFWHGIMHRREGDFSNAKYWFHKVGDHAAYTEISTQVAQLDGGAALLSGDEWDPFDFVDACQQALRSAADHQLCLAAQQIEWEVLFDYCYRRATPTR